jgi:hypothetical protein
VPTSPPCDLDKRIPALPYDDLWEGFDVTRVSQTSGLLCLSGDGHGFFLSRERWKLF